MSHPVFHKNFGNTCFGLLVFFVVFDLEVSLLLKVPYQDVLYKKFLFYMFFLFILLFGFFAEVAGGYARWAY